MQISEIKERVSPVMREYGVKKASIFGSVARGDNRPDSDVDLLVELGDSPMGMFKYMKFIGKVEDRLGRKVDIVTEGNASKFLKPYIVSDLKTIYEG